jgi:hypothetical protein
MTNNKHPHANTTAVEANYLALSAVTYANLRRRDQGRIRVLKIRVPAYGQRVAIDDKPKQLFKERRQIV